MTVTAVVIRPSDQAILVLPTGLPTFEPVGRFWHPDVEQPLQTLQEQTGIEAYVLTLIERSTDDVTYLMLSTGAVPTNAQWVRDVDHPAAALARQHLARPLGAPVTPAWTMPGWYDDVLPWIDDQLESPRTGRPIQVRSWGLSNVLRVPTAAGAVYFKAIGHSSTITPARPDALPLLFAHEPSFMAAISSDHPGAVVTPLAIDEKRGWMLLPDLGELLDAQPEISVWIDALERHARLQRSYVNRGERLLEAGCVDRRLAVLADALDYLVGPNPATERLDADQRAQLPQRAEELRAAIAELAAIGVPETLLHGDLHPRNIAVRDGVTLAFDWSDAALAHPFLDLVTFIEERSPISQDPRLMDAYLAGWAEYAAPADLRRALTLAKEIGGLYQVMTSLYLIDHCPPLGAAGMAQGAEWWLKSLLK
ncbi:aminoglycoside phosphotransferase family protein [Kribbella antibiotica]|uniref:aminoglycoside phosphotransferase family protein n=1 Tax=Kribbella antibiotica TaxID=190195 RepID=UPI0014053D17|nr:aminoglycoside phosphotransferase family protein [Kribbella antibiotica]